MYQIYLERRAERDLSRLATPVHDRVVTAIQALAREPRPAGCRKLVGTKNDGRIRVGDYHPIYQLAPAI